jgi:hypothetical protein
MKAAGQADCFTIINGPEDGAEFPIVRVPFYIGEDPQCIVQIRLDTGACPRHALVTVVPDGYRIRRLDRMPVYVNGKSAGMFRSRIARDGGLVQIGHTLLCIECSPDGLASRSHGIVSESDFGWAMQRVARWAWRSASGAVNFVLSLLGRILTSWLAVLSAVFLLYLFWPTFRFWLQGIFYWAYYNLISAIRS